MRQSIIELAPKDPNQYILKYQILRAQRAPIEQQIHALEEFKKAEYIEEWAYELAKLYQEAGMTAECLEECDDLILWFSEGKYVYQAMELKMQYKPLTPSQQEKYDRRYEKPTTETEELPDLTQYQKKEEPSDEEVEEELEDLAEVLSRAEKPLIIVGGGVKYSQAGEAVESFCEEFKIPFGETQAGKSACRSSHPYCLGGIGVTGTLASNVIAKDADVVLAIGSRLSDFTTGSKRLFGREDVRFLTINNCRFHAYKMDAVKAVGDAKATLEALAEKLRGRGYVSAYRGEIEAAKEAWDAELKRLGEITYTGESFEPLIHARDPRTIPEFVELTKGRITQTAALAVLNRLVESDATVITAGGSLPSCMQRMWRTDKRGGYHAEYGYSCMGYEVAATLGVKFAEPDCEVYCVVGDSSFQMMHSEIMTIMQERKKVNILIFDNCGFGCINNLEMNNGIGSLATEFRYTDGRKPTGDLIYVDYAKIGEGYGLKTYTCTTAEELEAALLDAKKESIACLFDLKVLPKTMTDGYESWWNVGIAQVSEKDSVRKACEDVMQGRREARAY